MSSRSQPFLLPENTPRSSKLMINIAGFFVYLYGVDELSPQQAKDTTVLFHVHGRTRTYKDAEDFAHQLLFEIRKRGEAHRGLVVAALDNRNHGLRAIDTVAVQDWKGGNPKHAQDMLSMIDGIVIDIKTVIKFLEVYIDGILIPTQFIITGLSLGGHVAWNILAAEPRIMAAIIIVGSPNLTDMLLERLGHTSASDVPKDKKEWPQSVQKLYQARDQSMTQISGKKILILNGALDTLVPSKFTRPWVENYGSKNDVTFVVYEGNGHWLSYEMIDKMVEWVSQNLI